MSHQRIGEVQEILRRELREIEEAGFTFRKGNFEYSRKRPQLIDIFRVGLHKMTEWYLVTPEVYCGCPKVNKLYNTIHGTKYSINDITFGFGIGNKFKHQRGRYQIDSEGDFKTVSQRILRDFYEVAIPWFAGITDIASVDAHMNAKNESGAYAPMSVGYACSGLVAAYLNSNPAFDEIAEAYYKFCLNAQGADLAEPILTTLEYLKTMPAK